MTQTLRNRPDPERIADGLNAAAASIDAAEEFLVCKGEDIGERGAGVAFLRWLAGAFRSGAIGYIDSAHPLKRNPYAGLYAAEPKEPDEHPEDAPEAPPREER